MNSKNWTMEKKICPTCMSEFSRPVWRNAMFCSKKCKIPWNKGLSSEKNKEVISSDKHYLWKGEGASYRSVHHWVETHLGKPNTCSECKKIADGRQIHWANVDHKYERNLSDWLRLCSKCHGIYDRKRGLRIRK